MFFNKNPALARFSSRYLSGLGFTAQDFGVHFQKAGGFM
jgi:hypothetical protein